MTAPKEPPRNHPAARGVKSSKPSGLCSTSRKIIKQAHEIAVLSGEHPKLAEHAAMIRRLGKRVTNDIIEIGRRLTEAKELVEHGKWSSWLKREFGWTDDTALNFMRVSELSKDFESRNFRDLRIAPSALYLLARKSTPEAVRTGIIERAQSGEAITVKAVKAATENEVKTSSPTQDWRTDIRRGFAKAVTVANEATRIGEQAHAQISPELRAQMREILEPQKGQLSDVRSGGQALIDYADFIERIVGEEEARC